MFLLTLTALLVSARVLGALARRIGLPSVVGEIAAGVALGPTGLARFVPQLSSPQPLLAGFTTLAVVLLLLVAGLEVDLRSLRGRGRTVLATAGFGAVIPMGAGIVLGVLLPEAAGADPTRRGLLAVVLGVALAISVLPLIARTLLELGLLRSEVGVFIMASAALDDLAGWALLAVLAGPMRGAPFAWTPLLWTTTSLLVLLAAGFVLRPAIRGAFALLGTVQGVSGRHIVAVVVFALGTSAVTSALGIHAAMGGLLAGVLVAGAVPERSRQTLERGVMTVLAPLFFASLGLRVDMVRAFDFKLCLLVLVVASVAKVGGVMLGARWTGVAWREAGAIGVGLNARGAMGVVVALLAFEAELLGERLYVALVVMALGTSVASGPLLRRILQDDRDEDVVMLLRRGGFVPRLHATNATDAIGELVRALGSLLAGMKRRARDVVVERELVAPTGIGHGVAIPHAVVEGLKEPVLVLGRAPHGIDFRAPDGEAATIVFLLLLPPKAYDNELRILASIARALLDERARKELLEARDFDEVTRVLSRGAARTVSSRPPPPRRKAGL